MNIERDAGAALAAFREYQENDEADYGLLLGIAEDMAEVLEHWA